MSDRTPLVLDAKQAARQLCMSTSTLAKMRLTGKGPSFSKLGSRVVYSPEDLSAWIRRNRFQSTSDYDEDRAGPAKSGRPGEHKPVQLADRKAAVDENPNPTRGFRKSPSHTSGFEEEEAV